MSFRFRTEYQSYVYLIEKQLDGFFFLTNLARQIAEADGKSHSDILLFTKSTSRWKRSRESVIRALAYKLGVPNSSVVITKPRCFGIRAHPNLLKNYFEFIHRQDLIDNCADRWIETSLGCVSFMNIDYDHLRLNWGCQITTPKVAASIFDICDDDRVFSLLWSAIYELELIDVEDVFWFLEKQEGREVNSVAAYQVLVEIFGPNSINEAKLSADNIRFLAGKLGFVCAVKKYDQVDNFALIYQMAFIINSR